MENNKLYVGALIYSVGYNGDVNKVIEIKRLTKTQAISTCEDYRFDIHISNYGTVRKIPRVKRSFSQITYHIETHDLKEKLAKQNLHKKIDAIDKKKLSVDKLRMVLAIIEDNSDDYTDLINAIYDKHCSEYMLSLTVKNAIREALIINHNKPPIFS